MASVDTLLILNMLVFATLIMHQLGLAAGSNQGVSSNELGSLNDDCVSRGCAAYPCFEETAHCGNEGYLIAFGEKYCRRFISPEIYATFDEPGKKFINCTSKCLIENMGKYMTTHDPINCDDLTNSGYNAQTSCYMDCDFCTVCKTNKAALFHVYDFGDIFSVQALKQVIAAISQCGIFACI